MTFLVTVSNGKAVEYCDHETPNNHHSRFERTIGWLRFKSRAPSRITLACTRDVVVSV